MSGSRSSRGGTGPVSAVRPTGSRVRLSHVQGASGHRFPGLAVNGKPVRVEGNQVGQVEHGRANTAPGQSGSGDLGAYAKASGTGAASWRGLLGRFRRWRSRQFVL